MKKVAVKRNLPNAVEAKTFLKAGGMMMKAGKGKRTFRPLTAAQTKLFRMIAAGKRPSRVKNPPPPRTKKTMIYDQVGGIWARKGQPHVCDPECEELDHWYEHVFDEKFPIYGLPNGKLEI